MGAHWPEAERAPCHHRVAESVVTLPRGVALPLLGELRALVDAIAVIIILEPRQPHG